MIVPNGQLQLFDMLSQSYLRVVNNSTRILTGIQAMPPTQDESTIILAIINLVGGSLYPFALSILLPVYMFTLVLEKEERLREMMKMNGMQMKYYWMINYTFFVLLYLVAVSLFYLFGLKVLDISFFKNTGFGVMVNFYIRNDLIVHFSKVNHSFWVGFESDIAGNLLSKFSQ